MADATRTRRPKAGSLTFPRIVERVTGNTGITRAELGNAVGATARTVQSWANGEATPKGARVRKLLDVQYIVEELSEVLTDEGIQIWLHSRNRNLGGQRPIDLLTEGKLDEVLFEAQRLSGAM